MGPRVGVCYGMVADNLPSPKEVVNLLQMYNIGKVRIFEAHKIALRAFANTGIEVIVGVGNDELQKIAGEEGAGEGWVEDNITPFYPSTNIKYIAVGNEVLSNPQYIPYLLEAMKRIQAAIEAANLQNNIKVSTAHASSVLGNSYPPSQGKFREDLKDIMKSLLEFLGNHESPLMANVYPYFSYVDNKAQISLDYALFRSPTSVVDDGGLLYKDLFDAMVDSLIPAMERIGHVNREILVSESGWTSESGGTEEAANMENARIYNNNLIRHLLSKEGTPRRSQAVMDTYIFGLFNENLKSGQETERHFGLFYPDKSPVYHVDFSSGSAI